MLHWIERLKSNYIKIIQFGLSYVELSYMPPLKISVLFTGHFFIIIFLIRHKHPLREVNSVQLCQS